jgi:quinol monooxygenase YgiN
MLNSASGLGGEVVASSSVVARQGVARVGLLVRFEAKEGHEEAVAALVASGPSIVAKETATTYWFGVRLGPRTFGIFDTFPDDSGRDAHVAGELAKALFAAAPNMLVGPPSIEKIDILAKKDAGVRSGVTVGLLARLEATTETAATIAAALTSGVAQIEQETRTPLWFAIRLGPTTFGIFDAFVDDDARQAHVASPFAQGLLATAPRLLAVPPTIESLDVLGLKTPR